MRLLLTILCFLLLACTKGQSGILGVVVGAPAGGTVTPTAAIETTIRDNNTYSGFPWPATLDDNRISTIWKESIWHPDPGPALWATTSDGGVTWDSSQIVVDGYGPVYMSNLSYTKLSGGRLLFSWQTDAVSSPMHFAKSLDNGVTWQYIGGITYHPPANTVDSTGYWAAQFGVPVELPSGKILQPYYDAPVNTNADPQHAGLVEISADLTTLSMGSFISAQSLGAWPNGHQSEVSVIVTHAGATDATTKLVALVRNETYEAFTHYRSADGGQTWTRNDVYLINVLFPNPVDKWPLHPILYNGQIYIFAGIRSVGDYFIAYVTVSPDDLYNNTGYSSLVRVKTGEAQFSSSSWDFGYPQPFVDPVGNLVVHYYDAHPDYVEPWPTPYRHVIVRQLPIITQ